jgi:hypothetical protein
VTVLVVRVGLAGDEVDRRQQAPRQVLMGRVDARVDDGDDRTVAARDRMGSARPDLVQVPLLAAQRVGRVGGRRPEQQGSDDRAGKAPHDGFVARKTPPGNLAKGLSRFAILAPNGA